MKQHNSRFLALITEARKQIKQITPQELKKLIDSNSPMYLTDVREESEFLSGRIPKANHISKGLIERDIERLIPDPDAPIVVYCSGGFRSVLVAQSLQTMGYTNVLSLDTGLQGWVNAGYELEFVS